MAGHYRQWTPSGVLACVIDAFWINEPMPLEGGGIVDRVLPDGCIDLIFRGSDAPGADPPRLFTSELIERAVAIDAPRQAWFVGVRFRPARSGAVLDLSPVECKNRSHHAPDIDRSFAGLEEELAGCRSPEHALGTLRRAVERRVLQDPERGRPPIRVERALTWLAEHAHAEPGEAGLIEAAHALGVSARSLHRDCVRWTGLAPKVLMRIFRMQYASRRIRDAALPLAQVALEAGFADQSHMTRELRCLTGATPAELRRALLALPSELFKTESSGDRTTGP